MEKLIILSRPGLMVLGGNVVAVDLPKNTVTLENAAEIDSRKRPVRVNVISSQVENLKIAVGMYVLATVKPSEELEKLKNGVMPKESPTVQAYYLRYTGAFDFAARGTQKEQHVFCGAVMKKAKLNNGGSAFLLSYKRQGVSKEVKLLSSSDITEKIGKKAVFLTDAPRKTKKGDIFYIQDAVNC